MSENRKKAEDGMRVLERACQDPTEHDPFCICVEQALTALLDSVQAEERLAIIKLILGGSFIHEMAPDAKFARSIVEAIRRERGAND